MGHLMYVGNALRTGSLRQAQGGAGHHSTPACWPVLNKLKGLRCRMACHERRPTGRSRMVEVAGVEPDP